MAVLPSRTGPAAAALAAAVLVSAALAGCQQGGGGSASSATTTSAGRRPPGSPSTAVPTTTTTTTPPPPTVVAAGDIAGCDTQGDEATAALVESLGPQAIVLTLGDNVYERGTAAEFEQCYAPTWGRFKDRTRPSPGNHDYGNGRAVAYFAYFGVEPWYAFDVGEWRLLSLNSNCPQVRGGCGPGSPQAQWLATELAAHRERCTLAYFHHPVVSSGLHGGTEWMAHLWSVLSSGGADVVLAGHDHHYERFAPVDGTRSFVVGTGGRSLYPIRSPRPSSEVRSASAYGVLALTLRPGAYDWRFVPVPGGREFTDAGSGACR